MVVNYDDSEIQQMDFSRNEKMKKKKTELNEEC
jgi:hypothetical protein